MRRYALPRARRLHSGRLARLLAILRRPRRIAKPLALVTRGELEQRLERAWLPIDAGVRIANLRESRRHCLHREVGGIADDDLVPRDGCGDARIGLRPHGVRRGYGAILGVLVVVDEHAVALFLPPFAGGQRRRPALHLARERERRAAHLDECPAPLEADDDVNA